jgi:hypothetical protein
MHVDILGLEAFLAIAQHGRFTKVGRALHITQTARADCSTSNRRWASGWSSALFDLLLRR